MYNKVTEMKGEIIMETKYHVIRRKGGFKGFKYYYSDWEYCGTFDFKYLAEKYKNGLLRDSEIEAKILTTDEIIQYLFGTVNELWEEIKSQKEK